MARLSNLSEVTQQISGRSKIKAQEEDWLHCLCSQPVPSVTCFGHWVSMQLVVSLQRMLALTSPPAALPSLNNRLPFWYHPIISLPWSTCWRSRSTHFSLILFRECSASPLHWAKSSQQGRSGDLVKKFKYTHFYIYIWVLVMDLFFNFASYPLKKPFQLLLTLWHESVKLIQTVCQSRQS